MKLLCVCVSLLLMFCAGCLSVERRSEEVVVDGHAMTRFVDVSGGERKISGWAHHISRCPACKANGAVKKLEDIVPSQE